jgi:hypothetical protein
MLKHHVAQAEGQQDSTSQSAYNGVERAKKKRPSGNKKKVKI